MAFKKAIITVTGANYLFNQFSIEVLELPTGGYRAVREDKTICESKALKILAKEICQIIVNHPEWLIKEA